MHVMAPSVADLGPDPNALPPPFSSILFPTLHFTFNKRTISILDAALRCAVTYHVVLLCAVKYCAALKECERLRLTDMK
jgi:hypothetical protein